MSITRVFLVGLACSGGDCFAPLAMTGWVAVVGIASLRSQCREVAITPSLRGALRREAAQADEAISKEFLKVLLRVS